MFCDGQYGTSVVPRLCIPTGSEPTKSPDDTLYCCAQPYPSPYIMLCTNGFRPTIHLCLTLREIRRGAIATQPCGRRERLRLRQQNAEVATTREPHRESTQIPPLPHCHAGTHLLAIRLARRPVQCARVRHFLLIAQTIDIRRYHAVRRSRRRRTLLKLGVKRNGRVPRHPVRVIGQGLDELRESDDRCLIRSPMELVEERVSIGPRIEEAREREVGPHGLLLLRCHDDARELHGFLPVSLLPDRAIQLHRRQN